jgi:hypothetical protein
MSANHSFTLSSKAATVSLLSLEAYPHGSPRAREYVRSQRISLMQYRYRQRLRDPKPYICWYRVRGHM